MNTTIATTAVTTTPAAASLFVNDFRRIVGHDCVVDASSISSNSGGSLDKYVVDWTRKYHGVDNVIAFPRTTTAVSDLLSFCNAKKVSVIPQGGNTGLVGGAVGSVSDGGGSRGGELILSLEKMNAIVEIDTEEAVLVAEAGCILETLSNAAAEHGLLVPLDLGAKGSCMIGGNVSTNAGGLRVIRYGSLHQNVLGLEVVQADGTVLNMLRQLPKDNCGYHLKHLFIGAEGTLGVVTKVAIALAPLPVNAVVALVKLTSFNAVGRLLLETRRSALSTNLSAFEFMDASSLSCMARASPGVLGKVCAPSLTTLMAGTGAGVGAGADALLPPHDRGITGEVLVLMEFSSGGNEGDAEPTRSSTDTRTSDSDSGRHESDGGCSGGVRLKDSLEQFLATLLDDDTDTAAVQVLDAVVSQNRGQELALWAVREHLPVCLMQLSRSCATQSQLFKYDVSMKLSSMDGVVLSVKRQLQREGYRIAAEATDLFGEPASASEQPCSLLFCNFGHAGDKNLHLNVLAVMRHASDGAADDSSLEVARVALDRAVYQAVLAVCGSISAEHGVGQKNRAAMSAARSPAELRLMAAIKRTLDPNNILNPRKVIPDGY